MITCDAKTVAAMEGKKLSIRFAGSREDEPRSSLERKWGAIRVLAPRSMGENKFGLGAARLYAKQLTDGDGQEKRAAAAERMRQENEGQSQSHKRGVCGSIHLSLSRPGGPMSEDRIRSDAFGPN